MVSEEGVVGGWEELVGIGGSGGLGGVSGDRGIQKVERGSKDCSVL